MTGERNSDQYTIAISPNGATWKTTSTAFYDYYMAAAAYGNGTWVVGGWDQSTNPDLRIIYSRDNGQTWTASTTVSTMREVNALVYGNSLWIASAAEQNDPNIIRIYTSPDGITWAEGQIVPYTGILQWNGTKFVGISNNGPSTVITSTDGLTWTDLSMNIYAADLKWNGVQWMIVGTSDTSGNQIYTSYNGSTWVGGGAPFPDNPYSLCWNGQSWVVVTASGGGTNKLWISKDGTTWTQTYTLAYTNTYKLVSRISLPYVPGGVATSSKQFTLYLDYSSANAISRVYVPGLFSSPSLTVGGIFSADQGSDLVFYGLTQLTLANTSKPFIVSLSVQGYIASGEWIPIPGANIGPTKVYSSVTQSNKVILYGLNLSNINGANTAVKPSFGSASGFLVTITLFYE
jgi:hypothetical protein